MAFENLRNDDYNDFNTHVINPEASIAYTYNTRGYDHLMSYDEQGRAMIIHAQDRQALLKMVENGLKNTHYRDVPEHIQMLFDN